MNKEKILKAIEEKDGKAAKEEMLVMFEEKLERKMWKIYKGIESDLKLDIRNDEIKNEG